MENGYSYYSTFMFYDEHKRRLSIFARKVGDTLEITVIPCSKRDNFQRKIGRQLYEQVIAGDEVKGYYLANIGIKDGWPKNSFLDYCRKNFYKKINTKRKMYISLLKKGGNEIYL